MHEAERGIPHQRFACSLSDCMSEIRPKGP